VGQYVNQAAIEANEGIGPEGPVPSGAGRKLSNTVVVTVAEAPKQAVKAVCALSESTITLHGATGSRRKPFVVHLSSLGIKQATFYLDGHRLKTLTAHNAHRGQLTLVLNAAKLSVGAHKLMAKITMAKTASSARVTRATRTITLLRCRSAVLTPKFTG